MRILSLGGAAGAVLFSLATLVSAALRPQYNHLTSFISELGASGTSYAPVMNYLGFVPAGLLLAVFGIALMRSTSRRVPALIGSGMVVLFGLGIAASGMISCDPGCPQAGGSPENTIHNVIGPLSFIAVILGVALLSYDFRQVPSLRSFSLYSFVTSVLALLFLVALVGSAVSGTLTGLWQRLLLATVFLWCAIIGIRTFQSHGT